MSLTTTVTTDICISMPRNYTGCCSGCTCTGSWSKYRAWVMSY